MTPNTLIAIAFDPHTPIFVLLQLLLVKIMALFCSCNRLTCFDCSCSCSLGERFDHVRYAVV